jgi:hypothetical protein
MPKQILKFERSNLLPKTVYDDIKRSPAVEISPYLFRIQVIFSSYGELDERVTKGLEAACEKLINDTQIKMIKPLRELLDKVTEDYKQEAQKPDPKAYERVKKLAKTCLAEIENMAEGLPAAIRAEIDGKLKTSVKEKVAKIENKSAAKREKTQTVGTYDFLGSGDGIRIKRGVFSGAAGAEDDSGDDLKDALKSVKPGSSDYEFVFIDGKEDGLEIKKRIQGGDIKAAKEQAGGSGKQFRGEVSKKGDTYYFELAKDCSKGTRSGLAKDIRALVKKKCKLSIKVVVDNEDKAEED